MGDLAVILFYDDGQDFCHGNAKRSCLLWMFSLLVELKREDDDGNGHAMFVFC